VNEVGDRVVLVATTDPWTRLRPGAVGTVGFVDSLGTVHVDWDSGSRLGLVPGEDHWRDAEPECEHGERPDECEACRQEVIAARHVDRALGK